MKDRILTGIYVDKLLRLNEIKRQMESLEREAANIRINLEVMKEDVDMQEVVKMELATDGGV